MTAKAVQSKIRSGQIKQAEFARVVHYATPDAGTTVEQMMKPEFWANVAEKIKTGDRIEVVPVDGSYFVEFIVRLSSRNSVVVFPLRIVPLEQNAAALSEDEDPDFYVKWRGGAKFCVMRKSDNTPVIENIETKEQAFREMSDYIKVHKPRAA